jgi:hypothetical protein
LRFEKFLGEEGGYLAFTFDGTVLFLPGYYDETPEQWGSAVVLNNRLDVTSSSNGFFANVNETPTPEPASMWILVALLLGGKRPRYLHLLGH